jgi:hypothetical protein
MHGIEFGYRYANSPVVSPEQGAEDSTLREYRPTAAAGARLPHLWREDGTTVHDALGDGYTLLCLENRDTRPLEDEMRRLGAPLETVRMPEAHLRQRYGKPLLLIRPDLHVAWRGAQVPDDCAQLARRVTGHG